MTLSTKRQRRAAAVAASLSALALGSVAAGAFFFAAGSATPAQARQVASASAATGKKLALIVAISDYAPKGAGGSDLPGCDQDALRMQKLLTEKFGFAAGNITLLADTLATRAAIDAALMRLADTAGPNDSVVFYYSGHGAQVPDLDGDEDDGWDEALVGADPVAEGAQTTETRLTRYVTDDRVAELLRRFKTTNVTVIFDSCHSGTAVRDAGPGLPPPAKAKRITPDFSPELLRQAEQAKQTKQADTKDNTLDIGDRYVFIAGCQSYETSGCVPAGGFLTLAIDAAARNLTGDLSWEEMAQPIREAVNRINATQTPSFEGATKRLPFALKQNTGYAPFERPSVAVAGSAALPKAGTAAPVEKVVEGKAGTHRALLEGISSLYQEQTGALYDVYPGTDRKFAGVPKGRVRITGDMERVAVPRKGGASVVERFATADIVSGSVSEKDRLLAVSIPIPQSVPRVGISLSSNSDADKNAARALYAGLKDAAGLKMVLDDSEPADYILQAATSGGGATVFGRGGWQVASFGSVAQVRDFIVARHLQATRLARLHNPSPAYRLVTATVGGDQVRRPGDKVGFQVAAAREGYYYVLTASQNGEPRIKAATDKPIAAGGGIAFDLAVPEPYEGRMMVKILHTTRPLDAPAIQTAPAAQRMDALFQALQKQVTTGGGTERGALSTDGWADATLLISVRNPNPG